MQSTMTRTEAARAKFGNLVTVGRAQAQTAIESLRDNPVQDSVIGAEALRFEGHGPRIGLSRGGGVSPMHRHAVGQACERASLPARYATTLLEAGRGDLLAHNLTELYHDPQIVDAGSRFLARRVGAETRGFLSDRFRRLDSAPIVEGIVEGMIRHQAVPIAAQNTDVRFFLQLAVPELLEPIPGEVMLAGLTFQNSDFGSGRLSVKGWIMRLICANGATAEEAFNQVHLGGRLGEDLAWSERTYRLDTEATVSQIRDVVDGVLASGSIKDKMLRIQAAHATGIDAAAAVKSLASKNRLTKPEAKAVGEAFNSAEIDLMPAGQTAWRLSNAISLIANAEGVDPLRKLDLQALAGEVAGLTETK